MFYLYVYSKHIELLLKVADFVAVFKLSQIEILGKL